MREEWQKFNQGIHEAVIHGYSCRICGHPVAEKFIRNAWGDIYCGLHIYEFKECSCCRRPICPSITGGGSLAPDGRAICNLCRKTAVHHLNQAWPAFNKVRHYLSQRGLNLVQTRLSLELVDRRISSSLPPNSQPAGAFTAMPAGVPVPVTGRTAPEAGEKVQILNGLPWELFTAVCACELGQAWLHMKRDIPLTTGAEWDFCKSLGCRWLESLGTSTADAWVNILQESRAGQYSMGPQAGMHSGERK